MNKFNLKKYALTVVLAIVLSLGIIRWHTQDGVPFCVNSAGCSATNTLRGKVVTQVYGYPSAYRQVEIFTPDNNNPSSGGYAGYKEARLETEPFSLLHLVTNFIFWFALLALIARFIKQRKAKATPGEASHAAPSTSETKQPVNPQN